MEDRPADPERAGADLALHDAPRGATGPRGALPVADGAESGGRRAQSDHAAALVRGWTDALAGRLAGYLPDLDSAGFARALGDVPGLSGHLGALAREAGIARDLEHRAGIDAQWPPLVAGLARRQGSAADADADAALAAARFAAAQMRFCGNEARMRLAPEDLPAPLFHAALLALREFAAGAGLDAKVVGLAEARIRLRYNEAESRLGLASRLVLAAAARGTPALALAEAGFALFASALAFAADRERDAVVDAAAAADAAAMAAILRAAGLGQDAIAATLAMLMPRAAWPQDRGEAVGSGEMIGGERA